MIDKTFQEVANNIKNAIANTRFEIMSDANKNWLAYIIILVKL